MRVRPRFGAAPGKRTGPDGTVRRVARVKAVAGSEAEEAGGGGGSEGGGSEGGSGGEGAGGEPAPQGSADE